MMIEVLAVSLWIYFFMALQLGSHWGYRVGENLGMDHPGFLGFAGMMVALAIAMEAFLLLCDRYLGEGDEE